MTRYKSYICSLLRDDDAFNSSVIEIEDILRRAERQPMHLASGEDTFDSLRAGRRDEVDRDSWRNEHQSS